jgi:hypothetical protein
MMRKTRTACSIAAFRPFGGREEGAERPVGGHAGPAVAGGRHDRDQRANPLRAMDRHRLGDHPAHRGADQVGRLDTEVVHESGRIDRHVIQ